MRNKDIVIGAGAAVAAPIVLRLLNGLPGVGNLVAKAPEAGAAAMGAAGLLLADQKGDVAQAGKVLASLGFAAAALGIARRLGLIKSGPTLISGEDLSGPAVPSGPETVQPIPGQVWQPGRLGGGTPVLYNVPGRPQVYV